MSLGYLKGSKGLGLLDFHQAKSEKMWIHVDKTLSPLVECSSAATAHTDIMRVLVIMDFYQNTPSMPVGSSL